MRESRSTSPRRDWIEAMRALSPAARNRSIRLSGSRIASTYPSVTALLAIFTSASCTRPVGEYARHVLIRPRALATTSSSSPPSAGSPSSTTSRVTARSPIASRIACGSSPTTTSLRRGHTSSRAWSPSGRPTWKR
jgi:hypothetical protein